MSYFLDPFRLVQAAVEATPKPTIQVDLNTLFILVLTIAIGIVGWFVKRHFDATDASFRAIAGQIDRMDKKFENLEQWKQGAHAELHDRITKVSTKVARIQGELHIRDDEDE